MKRLKNYYMHFRHHHQAAERRRWIFPLAIGSIFSLFLLFLTTTVSSPAGVPIFPFYRSMYSSFSSKFVEPKLKPIPLSDLPPPPRFAYLISGSKGDGDMLKRTLLALYHPNNHYVVHLDAESSPDERLDLANFVRDHRVFVKFGNVKMIAKANLVTYRGPTMVANTLHAAAILLREGSDWDWFINLSASDYPLVTQDDLLHVFSYLPRDLNFIDHTSDIGWKEVQRAKPIIVDPGLYMTKKSDVFWITQRRSVPTAFKLFTGTYFLIRVVRQVDLETITSSLWNARYVGYLAFIPKICLSPSKLSSLLWSLDDHIGPSIDKGSAWMVLSRPFVDYTIWGWDNLPRTALMYYSNFISSPEGYFHTVICNAQEFRNTTVNSDLHFISWDNPPKQHPHHLTSEDMQKMVDSNAPFARKFRANDPVLDRVDTELLSRGPGMFTPGGWCIGSQENGTDPCSSISNTTVVRPGPGAKRLETLISSLMSAENFRPRQCK
ncbi:Beta-glucuronosyltransferase GlcAT14A [Linum perenne]